MSAEDVAKALGGARSGSNGQWAAKCPAHEDRTASLSLKDGDGGKLLYNCHAGCSAHDVGAALRTQGLLPNGHAGEGYQPGSRGTHGNTRAGKRAKATQLGKLIKAYDYCDEHRALLFQVCRYDPKDFRQRQPDHDRPGEWKWTLTGVRRVLYRLPELVADLAATVYLTEGEKDADRLASLGLVATTSAQGAKSWGVADRAALAGRNVVVLPDNDDAGREYVLEVARDLGRRAASVRVLDIAGLPPKGDVSDWLDAGHTADELRELAAEAPPFVDSEHRPNGHAREGYAADSAATNSSERNTSGEPGKAEEAGKGKGKPKAKPRASTGSEPWRSLLNVTATGSPRDVLRNAVVVLRTDPAFAGRLRWNAFTVRSEARQLPWRADDDWRAWSDADNLLLTNWVQERNVLLKPGTCNDGVEVVAHDTEVHPVRDYLRALQWDGVERLDTWLCVYLGARSDPDVTANDDAEAKNEAVADALKLHEYHRNVGRKALISAVARVEQPGCQADHVLVLEGPQESGKSTAVRTLAVNPAWFSDQIGDLDHKDASQGMSGKWIFELAELSAIKARDVDRVKAFISRRSDYYRPAYGRRPADFPRQCIQIGTTNKDDYLIDDTGNRRFWPVKTTTIDIPALLHDRDQLWAEAVAAYEEGEPWHLDIKDRPSAAAEQNKRKTPDAWEPSIREHISTCTWTTSDVLLGTVLSIPKKDWDQRHKLRISAILKAAGWKAAQRRIPNAKPPNDREQGYRPAAPAQANTPDT